MALIVIHSLFYLSIIVAVLIVYVMCQKGWMNQWEKRKRQKSLALTAIIYDIWREEQSWDTFRLHVPRRYRTTAKALIVRLSTPIIGEMKETLQQGYEQLGYLADDLRRLRRGRVIRKIDALGRLQVMATQTALQPLVQAMQKNQSPIVRSRAARILSDLGYQNPKEYVRIFQDEDRKMANVHAETLIKQGSLVMEELIRFVTEEPLAQNAGLAVRVLAELPNASLTEHFITWSTSSSSEVRINAVRALGSRGGIDVVDTLVASLSDPHPVVRAFAVRGLGEHRAVALQAQIREKLQDTDAMVRSLAAVAVRKLEAQ